jgi:hypothetical protein
MLSDEIIRWRLGKVVKHGDIAQVSQMLIELSSIPDLRQEYQPQFERVREKYEWEAVMTPLIKFCEAPYLAADKEHLRRIPLAQASSAAWWLLPGKIWRTAKNYGGRELIAKVKEYLHWKQQK